MIGRQMTVRYSAISENIIFFMNVVLVHTDMNLKTVSLVLNRNATLTYSSRLHAEQVIVLFFVGMA